MSLLVLIASGLTAAHDRPRAFKAGVDLVTVDVCVRDGQGRFMPELTAGDFVVLDNGKPQQIAMLLPGSVPLRAVLLIDRSASMRGAKLTRAIEAATAFAQNLGPEDQLEVIAFNEQTVVLHRFERPPAEAGASLSSLTAEGMTGMHEALLQASDRLVKARRGETEVREVVILLSDGEDTSSAVDFQEVLAGLRRSGALVYAVSLRAGADGKWIGANWPLLQLASDTGGRALGVPSLDALPQLYREIDAEVRHLYRLGYMPSERSGKGEWRSISVRIPARDAKVRARAGYYASRGR